MPESTLKRWRNKDHAERYQQLYEAELPKIFNRMAGEMEELFAAEAELEWDMVDRLREELPNLKPGELSTALRNLGVTKALNADKSAPIRGRPNEVVHHSPGELVAKLKRLGVIIVDADEVVEGEAVEEGSAELEETAHG